MRDRQGFQEELDQYNRDIVEDKVNEYKDQQMSFSNNEADLLKSAGGYEFNQLSRDDPAAYKKGIMDGSLQAQQDEEDSFKNGGIVKAPIPRAGILRGPGTGTSDSIPARLPVGDAILPKTAVDRLGAENVQALATIAPGYDVNEGATVPARVSNGEARIPAASVEAVGKENIQKLIDDAPKAAEAKTTVRGGILRAAGGIDPDALERINRLTGVTGGRQASVPLPAEQASAQRAAAISKGIVPIEGESVRVNAAQPKGFTGPRTEGGFRSISSEAQAYQNRPAFESMPGASTPASGKLSKLAQVAAEPINAGLAADTVNEALLKRNPNNPQNIRGDVLGGNPVTSLAMGRGIQGVVKAVTGGVSPDSIAAKVGDWATKPLPIFAPNATNSANVAKQPAAQVAEKKWSDKGVMWNELSPEQQAAQVKAGNESVQRQLKALDYAPRALELINTPQVQEGLQKTSANADGTQHVELDPAKYQDYQQLKTSLEAQLTPEQKAQRARIGESAGIQRRMAKAELDFKNREAFDIANAPKRQEEEAFRTKMQRDLAEGQQHLGLQKQAAQNAKDAALIGYNYDGTPIWSQALVQDQGRGLDSPKSFEELKRVDDEIKQRGEAKDRDLDNELAFQKVQIPSEDGMTITEEVHAFDKRTGEDVTQARQQKKAHIEAARRVLASDAPEEAKAIARQGIFERYREKLE